MEPGSPDDLQGDDQPFFPLTEDGPDEISNAHNGAHSTPSPLSRIPLDIGHHRAMLFAIDTPVQFDQHAWERFVDNVWCLHNKGDVSAHNQLPGKAVKFWGGCRLQRMWKTADKGEKRDGRKRTRREPGMCPAKFRVIMDANGVRTLERSKEGHSHDLDYIDSVKRCSGVRNLVADSFFGGWDSGPILAYLKDPANAPANVPDILDLAGGKYLERREIINIFAIKLRAAYPGLDQHALKRQKEKYEGVKTCNVKGCNRAFTDAKELAKHKKDEHEQKKHDHSEKMYTCPRKECHRHKKSKGFVTLISLREHMLRMKHWGLATFHAVDGLRLVEAVTENEVSAAENGETIGAGQESGLVMQGHPHQTVPNPQSADLNFLSSMPTGSEMQIPSLGDHNVMMELGRGNSRPENDQDHRQLMLGRLQNLEAERLRMDQEMDRLRSALFAG